MESSSAVSAGTTFSDSGLLPLTSYAYQIVAYDSLDNASPSSRTISTAAASPPSAVSPWVTENTGTTISLAWNAGTSDFGVEHYLVSRDGSTLGSVIGTTFTDTPCPLAKRIHIP